MRGAERLVIAVPAVFALAWLMLLAERFGSADSTVYEAGKEMATWRTQPGRQTFDWIKADLERAVTRDPNDASLQEMLGRLCLVGSREEAAADEAIARFKRALQQRPTSPYSWASLVEALYRRGVIGPEFEGALQRAAASGPREPEVQRTVVDYGLAVWDEVSPSTRSAIDRMVANGMARDASEILQISDRRGRLGIACAHLDPSMRTDPRWTRNCP